MENNTLLLLIYTYISIIKDDFNSGRVPEDAILHKFKKKWSNIDIKNTLDTLEELGLVDWLMNENKLKLYYLRKN